MDTDGVTAATPGQRNREQLRCGERGRRGALCVKLLWDGCPAKAVQGGDQDGRLRALRGNCKVNQRDRMPDNGVRPAT